VLRHSVGFCAAQGWMKLEAWIPVEITMNIVVMDHQRKAANVKWSS
jgi:hypothetical protein